MKIFVLADPETCLAFAMAGIKGRSVDSVSELSLLLENLNQKEIGLILITERLAEKCREIIDKMILESNCPLILEIPDINGPVPKKGKAAERITSLLRS
ncbi:MAG: hypothetical protein B1H13_02945 [Desulfobacteraceae bacterium 4484_190.3]|nr:MAG: hypothetical protein B1H13_02945 [Desulfobacteraceae bacterium 4484_190.3]